MEHGGAGLRQRLLDRAERLLWDKQDSAMTADGWQIVKLGRWHRLYRHPALLAGGVARQAQRRSILVPERAA
jgi:hypothetical protein